MKLGLSGHIAKAFIASPLTPLLLLASLALGLIALMALPREEEPQISVPMVDIMVAANGLKAADAVELVTKPLEVIVKGIDAVEHVYSQTGDDRLVVTARFKVGTQEDIAILRVHEQVRAHMNEIPVGIPEPLIVGRGINDVAIVVLTLAPKPEAAERWSGTALAELAEQLRHELIKVDDVGLTYLSGARRDQIRVEPDAEKLALYAVTLNQLVDKVANANRSFMVGAVREAGKTLPVVGGQTLTGIPDIGNLLLTARDGRPVYVKDVARVVVGGDTAEHRAWHMARGADGQLVRVPAVSLALAKRAGANAVVVAADLLERLESIKARLLPADVEISVTRNYGETASDKADELLFHLGLATLSIVALITWALGWREGVVVALVVPTTILLTLFASHVMGYTINRVSLFALIFSIGILVDDAIVVVENIVRRWRLDKGTDTTDTAIRAVAEVGNPTIVATLTIVVALLPMMFVSGLMGPYMSPIPANASSAMVFSFFVAVAITPWLLVKVAGRNAAATAAHAHSESSKLSDLYLRIATPLLEGRGKSKRLLLGVTLATLAAMAFFPLKLVTVKLLPFDNKSELQVVIDLPEGAALEDTERVLMDAAARLKDLAELSSIQAYAGTGAPFNFNGLVRHSYLRQSPELGDLQINLLSRHDRERASHAIALDVRQRLNGLPMPEGTAVKVVEVPPGPPVLSTLLAEIYGPDHASRREAAAKVREAFQAVDFIVDVDDSLAAPQMRLRISIDQEKLEFHGVEQQAVYDTITALMGGVKVGYSHRGGGATPLAIVIGLPKSDMHPGELLANTPVPSRAGVVELGDVVKVSYEPASAPLFRRDGRFAEMITAELAGRFEAPIYGMFAVNDRLEDIRIAYHGQPRDESSPTLLWDGEWEITYVTFRDMGAAFGVAILGIYLLVVAQFGSFRLPLVILVPVPLTLIGIVVGHLLFGAPFTATSMIGFIALAGIIVRNSILLVDFIRHRQAEGASLRRALLDSGATRVKPIVLTAAAAMIGAAFILTDPIFQGLALSLVFGLMSSTLLTLLVIPALYIWLRDDGKAA
ncbi:efflux RND transporter permease subunit [Magnetospirillum sp. SS-4]|uniref:efflux RND transporter permease subunit n=1 Tax=Magnetospirillum sp. SS-4 TaxID=2681465 RepID=UPI0013830CEC|nr:efflux RND transporter permease subunit [Magnetospirillum sp. SS-4]CAA7612451.1 AcrB/AcrD/AcrF family cation efflux protein [Magnetospirillum sp. SS-4]